LQKIAKKRRQLTFDASMKILEGN